MQSPTDEFISIVGSTIQENELISAGSLVLVAVSGGADSVALLESLLLYQARGGADFEVAVAHLNHAIRSQAAQLDQRFVEELAQSHGLPCISRAIDVPALARQEKRSLEEAARIARRRFLEDEAARLGATRIALGHTQDDQVETFFLNLLRGTGPRGLGAMSPGPLGPYIRPLLNLTRGQVLAFLNQLDRSWREDETNQDPAMLRNRVRHCLIPLLEQEFCPTIKERVITLSGLSAQMDEALDLEARHCLENLLRPLPPAAPGLKVSLPGVRNPGAGKTFSPLALDCRLLLDLPAEMQRRVLRLAYARVKGSLEGLGFHHIESLRLHALRRRGSEPSRGEAGPICRKVDLPGAMRPVFHKNLLILAPVQARRGRSPARAECAKSGPEAIPLTWPGSTDLPWCRVRITARCQVPPPRPPNSLSHEAWLDLAKLSPPLVIRPRLPGEQMRPLGMEGRRAIRRVMQDAAILASARPHWPLVADARGAVWVPGACIDERCRITPETQEGLHLVLENLED